MFVPFLLSPRRHLIVLEDYILTYDLIFLQFSPRLRTAGFKSFSDVWNLDKLKVIFDSMTYNRHLM